MSNKIERPKKELLVEKSLFPDMSERLTLWMRGDRVGKHTFSFQFSYESVVRQHRCRVPYFCTLGCHSGQAFGDLQLRLHHLPISFHQCSHQTEHAAFE